ncbi:MAG: hypothetical protein IJX51_07865 [Clostridia bacterium]|nr:hypothetical protein [Clostridia bacterium]
MKKLLYTILIILLCLTSFMLISCGDDGVLASEGLEFELNKDNSSYFVKGIGDCKDTELIIPSVYMVYLLRL